MPNFITKPKSMYKNPDEKLSRVGCIVPFNHLEIHISGKVSACCQTWLPTWVGNLLTDDIDSIINNADRKKIQDDMRKGVFDHCNDLCPQLNSYLHDKDKSQYGFNIIPIENLNEHVNTLQTVIYFSYDPSCNLQCPSCRHELIVWDPNNLTSPKSKNLVTIHNKVKELVLELLKVRNRVTLSITGSGDPFASPIYWEYLIELSQMNPIPENLVIYLQTNGIMMTSEYWEKIKPLWPHIGFVNVSVDAATEDTYKIVRKNGNFKKLQKNLNILDQMFMDKCFPNLEGWQTNFIVQRDNFKELKQFVEWQLEFKSKPWIWTNLIAQWYHLSDAQFNSMAVWQENHPDRSELIEILKDPIFQNSQLKLGNMNALMP
jgi:MoaA/NifB/PqqE/SkfB family radical SAM enzyme